MYTTPSLPSLPHDNYCSPFACRQATSFNFAGLFVARVGLGVFEACFGPGIPLYMCTSPCPYDMPYADSRRFAFPSLLLHKRGNGDADGLLVWVCSGRRRIRRSDCIWGPARPCLRGELETPVHHRGSADRLDRCAVLVGLAKPPGGDDDVQ